MTIERECPYCQEYRMPDAWIALETEATALRAENAKLREALDALICAEEDYGDENNVAINQAWMKARAALADKGAA